MLKADYSLNGTPQTGNVPLDLHVSVWWPLLAMRNLLTVNSLESKVPSATVSPASPWSSSFG
jgi:hypothetical protein